MSTRKEENLDREEIGKRLSSLRKEKGKTQHDIAVELNVSDMAISLYERGERIPRDEIKIKLASYYGKSVESIFYA